MGIVLISFLMGNGLILPWTLQIQWKTSEGGKSQLDDDHHKSHPMKIGMLIMQNLRRPHI